MATKIIAAKAVTAKRMAAKTIAAKALVTKAVNKDEVVFSHPTMCLHCHLIVEMFHERGADPVRGSWQCPRCNHKYLFSHWKIKRPVSYTHLRAHETPEHLVCRLLLEKKK